MLFACGLGLALTAVSAASPGYWWFVLVFALGRPFLSAAAAISQVQAAEQTRSAGRASAMALVAAGYAVGAGLTAVVYGLAGGTIGYRGVLVLAVVPLVALPFLARSVTEPDRFRGVRRVGHGEAPRPRRRRPPLPRSGWSWWPRWPLPWRSSPGHPTPSSSPTPRTSRGSPASRSRAWW